MTKTRTVPLLTVYWGKLFKYAFDMWPRVSRYFDKGYYQIVNNGKENAIRSIALGHNVIFILVITIGLKTVGCFTLFLKVVCKSLLSHINVLFSYWRRHLYIEV